MICRKLAGSTFCSFPPSWSNAGTHCRDSPICLSQCRIVCKRSGMPCRRGSRLADREQSRRAINIAADTASYSERLSSSSSLFWRSSAQALHAASTASARGQVKQEKPPGRGGAPPAIFARSSLLHYNGVAEAASTRKCRFCVWRVLARRSPRHFTLPIYRTIRHCDAMRKREIVSITEYRSQHLPS